MTIFQVIALLVTLTALFSYVNFRFIKLPPTIGVMLITLVVSLGLIGIGHFNPAVHRAATDWLKGIDFNRALMQGMLSFLLFAGALHINLNELFEEKGVVAVLAVGGVILSTLFFGSMMYCVLGWLGLKLSFAWCLLFGALISPTDPVAVIGILKNAKAPRPLEVQIAGESLFNDGVGVVAFLVCSEITADAGELSAGRISMLLLQEAVGGAVFGFVAGYITYRLLRSVDHYQVEALLTLALVTGGYALASALHLSGPIAIVVAGLLIGNHGRALAMSQTTREHLDTLWELIDEALNGILFVLIGLEILVLTFTPQLLLGGLIAIPVVLLARWMSVGIPIVLMKRWHSFSPGTVTIMSWGGLRGGISVALALSLPTGPERTTILVITYVIVVFSILVQGLTIGRVVRNAVRSA